MRLSEEVQDINDIQHLIVRETLKEFKYENIGLDISYIGDLPGGSRNGFFFSAFTAALILALKTSSKEIITPYFYQNYLYFIERKKI